MARKDSGIEEGNNQLWKKAISLKKWLAQIFLFKIFEYCR